jgi:hypothetical protein
VLKKCADLGIDANQLTADLASGETTADTTTYFVLCNPVSEPPTVQRAHRAGANPPRICRPREANTNSPLEPLPALSPPRVRAGAAATLGGENRSVINVIAQIHTNAHINRSWIRKTKHITYRRGGWSKHGHKPSNFFFTQLFEQTLKCVRTTDF